MFKPQSSFPLIEEYKKAFVIDKFTIFAYDETIYCDYKLSDDLIIHEQAHLEQQRILGLDNWVKYYLSDMQFRLNMEVEAYTEQLASIKDRNLRAKVRQASAKALSSNLYGNIVSFEEALKMLK